MMKSKEFIADGVILGGIYAFKLGNCESYCLKNKKVSNRFEFSEYDNQEDEYRIIENKNAVFGKNQKWSLPELKLKIASTIDITLSDNKIFNNVKLHGYISIYYQGFSTILFWMDIENEELNYLQILELISLIKDQQFNNQSAENIVFKQYEPFIKYNSFLNLFQGIQKELELQLELPCSFDYNNSLIYPITYIKEVKNCSTSSDLIKYYSKEIVGICDTWKHFYTHFKESEIKRVLDTDIHPFDYGLTVYTSAGMVEIHSSNFGELIGSSNITHPQRHFYEQIFLYILTEVSILNLFVLKWYDTQLTSVGLKAFKAHLKLMLYIKHLNKITRLHNSTIESISLFKDVHFASKSYIPQATNEINNILGISKFSESVKDKLNDIKQQLTITYSMITTVFVIILTVIGLLIGLSQIFIALRPTEKNVTSPVVSKPIITKIKVDSPKNIKVKK